MTTPDSDIIEGHQKGTRYIYTHSTADRPLTLEEDLAQLREAYESHAKFFEERKHIPVNLSSQIIDAGRSFLSKVSALGNPDRNSMMNLITSMKMS